MRNFLGKVGLWECIGGTDLITLSATESPSLNVVNTISQLEVLDWTE